MQHSCPQTSDLHAIQQQFGNCNSRLQYFKNKRQIQDKLEKTFVGHLESVQATNLAPRASMEERLLSARLSAQRIRDGDEQTVVYTGLSSFSLFKVLFQLLKSYASSQCGVKVMCHFLLVIVKLLLNITRRDLAYHLYCSEVHFPGIAHVVRCHVSAPAHYVARH